MSACYVTKGGPSQKVGPVVILTLDLGVCNPDTTCSRQCIVYPSPYVVVYLPEAFVTGLAHLKSCCLFSFNVKFNNL